MRFNAIDQRRFRRNVAAQIADHVVVQSGPNGWADVAVTGVERLRRGGPGTLHVEDREGTVHWRATARLRVGPLLRKSSLSRDSGRRWVVRVTRDTLASPDVSPSTENLAQHPTPPSVTPLPLIGGPMDARLPLALLEAVRAIDTPATELDAELVHELRNKRFGLSDTVLQQIRRYNEAVKRQQQVPFEEVLALARLIGRRPDADLTFREAGRRVARSAIATIGATQRTAGRTMPALIGRPIALRVLRRIFRRFMDGEVVRNGSALMLEVGAPVTADAAPRAAGCGLYEAAFREALQVLAGVDGAVDHVMCRARGDARCQWRADWRRG